jgi:hypothetical protein
MYGEFAEFDLYEDRMNALICNVACFPEIERAFSASPAREDSPNIEPMRL